MSGIHQGIGWQGKKFLVNAVVKLSRIPLLEIRSPTASDQEGITGEDAVMKMVAHTALGVPWCMENLPFDGSHLQTDAIGNKKVRAECARSLMHDAVAAQAFLQEPGACDVVRVNVCFQGIKEAETKTLEKCRVRLHFTGHRVDEKGPMRDRAAQEVGIGGGLRLKKLVEDHRASPSKTLEYTNAWGAETIDAGYKAPMEPCTG